MDGRHYRNPPPIPYRAPEYAIKVIGSAFALLPEGEWRYIKSFEDTPCGRGVIDFTDKLEEARAFPSIEAALAFWKTQSRLVPKRHDGKPNRPMTAYTIEFEPIIKKES